MTFSRNFMQRQPFQSSEKTSTGSHRIPIYRYKLIALVLLFQATASGLLSQEIKSSDDYFEKDPIPKSYKISTEFGEKTFNFTPNLGDFNSHGLQLCVWMVPDKFILGPTDDLTITIYYENISKMDIWIPDIIDFSITGRAITESKINGLNQDSSSDSSSSKKIAPGFRGSFKIRVQEPISDNGFLQINVSWGLHERIVPNPITIEGRKSKVNKEEVREKIQKTR